MQRRLNKAQRVVLVIGWGLVLVVATSALTKGAGDSGSDWYNFAPNQGVLMRPPDLTTADWALRWLVTILLWIVVALVILRSDRQPD